MAAATALSTQCLDVQPWLPRSVTESNYGYYEDPKELDTYEKMLHQTDLAKQRALMLQYNERVLDEEAHYIHSFWWNRLGKLCKSQRPVIMIEYVRGWISTHGLGDEAADIGDGGV